MDDTDAGTDPLRIRYDWSDTVPSAAVVRTVAAREGIGVLEVRTELETTLYDHVDPEALDALVTGDGHVSVSFTFDGYQCWIEDDQVTVTET
ncbi:HalOD1 output domain-containing protein [Natrialbaceae archaeon A-gly3]